MQGGQGVCAVRAAGGEAEVQVEEAVEHPAAAGGDGGGREVGAGGGLGAGGQAGQESCGVSLVVPCDTPHQEALGSGDSPSVSPMTSTQIMAKIDYVPLSDLQVREAVLKFTHINWLLPGDLIHACWRTGIGSRQECYWT